MHRAVGLVRRAPIRVLWCDSSEPRLIADPIEPIDANDPTVPMLANEPTDPIESTEPSDHSDSTEPRDPIDQRLLHMARAYVADENGVDRR